MRGLSIRDLKIYTARDGSTPILEIDNLEISDNTIFGFFGKNGSGKTALLRSILGLIPQRSGRRLRSSWAHEGRIMSGEVILDGVNVAALPTSARSMSFVPQHPTLYPDKTVLENLAFPLFMAGRPRADALAQAAALAELLGLSSIAHRVPGQISGGQQQKTALGRALIHEPRLTLLDEPLSSVDIETRRELQPYIARLLRDRSGMAIYVAHDGAELSILCDAIAFIDHGRIAQVATPTEAYTRPAKLSIARSFSGFLNAVSGALDADGTFHPAGIEGTWATTPPGRAIPSCTLATRASAFLGMMKPGGVNGRLLNRYHTEGVEYGQVELLEKVVVTCRLAPELELSSAVFVHCVDPSQCLIYDADQRLTVPQTSL